MVVEVLLARDELLTVERCSEEPAALVVAEQVDGQHRESARVLEPAQLPGREVQLVEAVGNVRVILEHARVLRLARAPAAVEPPLLRRERPEEELGDPAGGLEVVDAFEPAAGFGERGEREAVPGCDRLVIAQRFLPELTLIEQTRTELRIEGAADDEPPVLERLQQLARNVVVLGPRVGQALDAVGVGVLRRREAAFGQAQVAQQVVERFLRDLAIALVPGHEPAVQVHGGEQRVVVEHLLEVRDEPLPVDGIAVKAAADEVVHAARGHRVQCLHRRLQLTAAQEKLESRRRWELRRVPEAAPLRIELATQRQRGLGEQRGHQRLAGRLGDPAQLGGDCARISLQVGAAVAPGVGHRLQQLLEARQSVTRFGRVIGTAEERLTGRRQEDRHRPASVPGERDDGVHIDRVDVGTLLTVDLHRDEVLVEQCRRGLVLERLVRHHVTPVTRRVADGEHDRLVLLARAQECFFPPRKPIHRIFGVLQEVWARLLGESVHAVTPCEGAASLRPRR